MYDTVLIPTDGSPGTETVLDHGVELARRYEATVHALYVVDRRQYLGEEDDVQADVAGDLHAEGEHAVAVVADRAAEAGVDAETAVVEGVPDKDIVEYVEAEGIDVVVMGTHGRTGRDKLARLGSVTERVVKNAPVPVFVINLRDG
jgi:nucleotide-binding universal stress UspA family protein